MHFPDLRKGGEGGEKKIGKWGGAYTTTKEKGIKLEERSDLNQGGEAGKVSDVSSSAVRRLGKDERGKLSSGKERSLNKIKRSFS